MTAAHGLLVDQINSWQWVVLSAATFGTAAAPYWAMVNIADSIQQALAAKTATLNATKQMISSYQNQLATGEGIPREGLYVKMEFTTSKSYGNYTGRQELESSPHAAGQPDMRDFDKGWYYVMSLDDAPTIVKVWFDLILGN